MGFFIEIIKKISYNENRFIKDKELSNKNLTNPELNIKIVALEHDMENIRADVNELKPLLTSSIKQQTQYEYIIQSLDSLKVDIQEIKKRPSKLLDYIIMTIIASLIAGIFKFFGV